MFLIFTNLVNSIKNYYLFLHLHPYQPFIPENAIKLIVGTIPPPRFSIGELFKEDINFCYGSKYGLLWPILDEIFDLNMIYKNSDFAINQRKEFLIQNKIGICDIVESCERDRLNASDLGMKNIKLRDVLKYLSEYPTIKIILFMGGNSKNGPEYFFRSHLRERGLKLKKISVKSPKIYQFKFENRLIKTVSLISPSNAANRSIGANIVYKESVQRDKNYSTFKFRLDQYKDFFND